MGIGSGETRLARVEGVTAEVGGALFRAMLDSDVRVNPGDELSLVPKPDRIRWFDVETSAAA